MKTMKSLRSQWAAVVGIVAALLFGLQSVQAASIPSDVLDSIEAHETLHLQLMQQAGQTSQASQIPAAVRLLNISHEYQGWNNCGPTTIGMDLRFWGMNLWQKDTAPVLKPNPNDKNVSPYEMVNYARSQGMGALERQGGNIPELERLVTNGFPVILQIWYMPEDLGGWGHYRLLTGFDDNSKTLYFADAYLGPEVHASYATIEDQWRVFDRTYIVVYPKGQEAAVTQLLGENANDQTMKQIALSKAQADLARLPNDSFAWYTLGRSQHALGDDVDAAAAFDKARAIGMPPRMLWYQFDLFQTYLALGRNQDVINITTPLLASTPELEESHYYKGKALEALGRKAEALKEYQAALQQHPGFTQAAQALKALASSGGDAQPASLTSSKP